MLMKTCDKDLRILTLSNVIICLYVASENGQVGAAEVRRVSEGVCRKTDRKEGSVQTGRERREWLKETTHLVTALKLLHTLHMSMS